MCFYGIAVRDELFRLELDELHVLSVQRPDDLRVPVGRDARELLGEVDYVHRRCPSFARRHGWLARPACAEAPPGGEASNMAQPSRLFFMSPSNAT